MTGDLTASPRYTRPTRLDEALAAIAQPGAVVIAGGQSLIPRLVSGVIVPTLLVDLSAMPELGSIDFTPDVMIGAMVSLTSVIESDSLADRCPLIRQVAVKTATPTIRNRATLVGNLVVADPASQLPTAMIALGATLLLQRSGSKQWVDAEAFFVGPNLSIAGIDEIVTHIRIPCLPVRAGCGITDVASRRNSRALATATAIVAMEGNDRISFARLSVSGCGDVPTRCRSVENALLGADLAGAPDIAMSMLGPALPPFSRGVLDAEYAAMVLPALMRRSVDAACASARTKPTLV